MKARAIVNEYRDEHAAYTAERCDGVNMDSTEPQVAVDLEDGTAAAEFARARAERIAPMIAALASPASVLLLVGSAGSGKSHLAKQVARELHSASPESLCVFEFRDPSETQGELADVLDEVFLHVLADADEPDSGMPAGSRAASPQFPASAIAARLRVAAEQLGGGGEPIFVMPAVDRYSPRAIAVLEHLIRQHGVRIIATSIHVSGGAAQMSRDPRVMRMTVAPLTLDEADALLASILGRGRMSQETLRRWHTLTEGNSYAITMMLVANQRAGTLLHRRGIAYVPRDTEQIPIEFANYLAETCSDLEIANLELIALAAPMSGTRLLQLVNPDAVAHLLDRSLIHSTITTDGDAGLRIATPILSAAIVSSISPPRRAQLLQLLFDTLTQGRRDDEFAHASAHLVQVVELGLKLEIRLPELWLQRTISHLLINGDPNLMLRVSLVLAHDYDSVDAAAAAVRAVAYAIQLGRGPEAAVAYRAIDDIVSVPERLAALPAELRVRVQLTQLEHLFHLNWPMPVILERLDRLQASFDSNDLVAIEIIRGMRFRLMIRDGQFTDADFPWVVDETHRDFVIDSVRSPARSMYAAVLAQQGRVEEGLQIANRARNVALMGRRPLNDRIEMQSFFWFLCYWASGDLEGARNALEEIQSEAEQSRHTGDGLSRVTEIAWAMLALQQAHWGEAVTRAEQMLENPVHEDPFGTTPLLNTIQALGLAAMGHRKQAVAALERAQDGRRGLSQVIDGYRRRMLLQTQQWLRLGDLSARAMNLADWARTQQFGLIELQALHIAAVESPENAVKLQARAGELADSVDPLIAEVILNHIDKIASGASATDVSIPEVRLLAELGLWLPLPASSTLSAREREISLLASLGYPSRFIADRLHLSVRTVETHLAHVYAKIGVTDRAGLRDWFSADRRFAS